MVGAQYPFIDRGLDARVLPDVTNSLMNRRRSALFGQKVCSPVVGTDLRKSVERFAAIVQFV
jgi:hypothetical protein